MKFRSLNSLDKLYEINENGILRNCKTKKIIKGYKEKNGYVRVRIENKELPKIIRTSIHQLVAEAFIPNIEKKPCVNHINSIRDDNRSCNLEWVTNSENMKHAYRNNGLKVPDNSKRIIEKESGMIFSSITEYAKHINSLGKGKNVSSNISYISSVLRGKRNRVFGKIVEYIDKEAK